MSRVASIDFISSSAARAPPSRIARDRRAFALRYLGDDIRYLERDGAPPDSQRSAVLSVGDLMDGAEFPLIWTQDQGYLPLAAG